MGYAIREVSIDPPFDIVGSSVIYWFKPAGGFFYVLLYCLSNDVDSHLDV